MTTRQPEAPTVGALAARLRLHEEIAARYGEPLRELLKLWPIHPEGFGELVVCVLRACEEARQRAGRSDVHAELRKRDRQVLADLPRALAALDELRRFVRRHQDQVAWAASDMILRLRGTGFRFDIDGARDAPPGETLQRMLDALREGLASGLPAKRGALRHRFQEGALLFDQPRDQQDRGLADPVLTALMFRLVYLFRRFTAGMTTRGQALYGGNPRMPVDGKPCYRLAIAFVDAALDRHTEDARSPERRFNKWLRANPDAELAPWPRERSPRKKL